MSPSDIGKIIALLGALSIVTGCGMVRTRVVENQLNEQYSSFVGQPVSEAVIQFGPPTSQINLSATERIFQWDKRGMNRSNSTASAAFGIVTVNPSQVRETRCLVNFVARATSQNAELSQWIIHRWQWNASDVTTC